MTGPANPFTPGRGRIPPHRVEQRQFRQEVRKHVDAALSRTKGAEVHLHGPRGCGKTSLLRQIGLDAARDGALVMRAGELAGRSRTKCRDLLRKIMQRKAAVMLVDDAHKAPGRRDRGGTLVSAQEAADAMGIGAAFHAARNLVRGGHPVLLVVGGAPLDWEKSPWKRGPDDPPVHTVHMGLLAPAGSAEALSVPAERAGMPLDEDALDALAREGGGHPALLQALGHAAWEAARASGGKRIRRADAEQATLAVRGRKERALAARTRLAARFDIIRKCRALAEVMTRVRPHDQCMLVTDSTRVFDLANEPSEASPTKILELTTRLGLFHAEMTFRPIMAPSYPTICEHLVSHAGGGPPILPGAVPEAGGEFPRLLGEIPGYADLIDPAGGIGPRTRSWGFFLGGRPGEGSPIIH